MLGGWTFVSSVRCLFGVRPTRNPIFIFECKDTAIF